MPITYKSNGQLNREIVKDYLRDKKAANPNFKVMDIGGVVNPWCDEFVDAYADIKPREGKKIYVGDINEEQIWEDIASEHWDFCICTHLLEDIRDPKFVIEKIQRHFSAGFISMPNKHTEFSNIQSKYYVGYCHHRWIFQITLENKLRAIAKFPITSYFGRHFYIQKALSTLRKLFKIHVRRKSANLLSSPDWVDKKLARKCELSFLWEKDFSFEYINNDYASDSCAELTQLYCDELREGL